MHSAAKPGKALIDFVVRADSIRFVLTFLVIWASSSMLDLSERPALNAFIFTVGIALLLKAEQWLRGKKR